MKYLISLVLLLLLSSCSKNPAELRGKARLDYLYKHGEIFGGLKAGMTKDQIRAILGPPENLDDDYVWMYADIPAEDERKRGWEDIAHNGNSYACFLVFYNGKSVFDYTMKIAEESPQEGLAYGAHIPDDKAIQLLNDARLAHSLPDPYQAAGTKNNPPTK